MNGSLGDVLKNKLILLALAIPLFAGPNVGHAIADFGALGDPADESTHPSHFSQSKSVSRSVSDLQSVSDSKSVSEDEQYESDCCHADCVCCMGQGLGTTTFSNSPVNASETVGIRTLNIPNPHLEGLLRPPRFG